MYVSMYVSKHICVLSSLSQTLRMYVHECTQVVSCLRPWKYLSVVLVVYALIGNAFICNMEVEADGGGKVLVRDMLRSVVGEELLQPFRELYVYVRVNGLYNVLSEICQEVFAEEPEAAAFALFGFDADDDSVTLKDVKKRWKAMVLEWHPDKYQV